MLGFGKKDVSVAVGAKEKMRRAQQAKNAGSGSGGGAAVKKQDISLALVLILGVSVALAVLLTESGAISKLPALSFLPTEVDRILTGSSPYSFIGNTDIDFMITALIRGLAIFLAAGIIPFVAKTWNQMRNNMHANVYVSIWGTMIALPFAIIFIKDFFGPLLMEVIDLFVY